ncbi:MAG: glycerophosphodiester phosphodiesterase [Betaproteobacteria bacterium]|nr:glycerophosphodiester phosphodiesterase [Betaproteobacteria bacterium]
MLLLAHRGYHADTAENTMPAFEAAVKLGVDGIETDVRLSSDGLPVIIHERLTPHQRAVAGLTRRELERDLGHPVPVLAEILDAFPDVLWNVEIKNPEALPAALPVLMQFRHTRRLLLTSFRHDVVIAAAREIEIECGLLLAHRPLDAAAIIAGCINERRIRAIVWDYNIVDEAALRTVTVNGWSNYVYGALTHAEHQHCAGLGLAGLITDYPLHVLGRQAHVGEAGGVRSEG